MTARASHRHTWCTSATTAHAAAWKSRMAARRKGRTFASIPHEEALEMTAPRDLHPCIVVGFDGSAASHVALSRAIERVGPNGKLYLVHAWEVPETWRGRGTYQPYVDRALTEAEAVMETAVEAHRGLKGIPWEP